MSHLTGIGSQASVASRRHADCSYTATLEEAAA